MKCPQCQSPNLLFLPSEHEDCCLVHTHYGTCLNCSAELEMHHTKEKDPEYACSAKRVMLIAEDDLTGGDKDDIVTYSVANKV